MRTIDDEAIELITFYQKNIETLYDRSHSRDLARLFAMDHCDRVLLIMDSKNAGWMDCDLVSRWKAIKMSLSKC